MSPEQTSPQTSRLAVLVVVGVVIAAASILLPAIIAARETARRMSCSNNFKQIGLAIHNYDSAYKQWPTAYGGTGLTPGNDALSNQRRLSALVGLTPFMESSPMWGSISSPFVTDVLPIPVSDPDGHFVKRDWGYSQAMVDLLGADGPLLDAQGLHYFPAMGPAPWLARDYPPWQLGMASFRCPSDSVVRPAKHAALSNYVAGFGTVVRGLGRPLQIDTLTSAQRTRLGVFTPGGVTRMDDITDGLATTIAMAEAATFDGTRSARGAVARNVAGLGNDVNTCLATVDTGGSYRDHIKLRMTPDGQGSRGGNWADGAVAWSGFTAILPPNSPSCESTIGGRTDGVYSASSLHLDGCHVLMCDGAVIFVTDSVDVANMGDASAGLRQSLDTMADPKPTGGVWGAMGTRAENEARESDALSGGP